MTHLLHYAPNVSIFGDCAPNVSIFGDCAPNVSNLFSFGANIRSTLVYLKLRAFFDVLLCVFLFVSIFPKFFLRFRIRLPKKKFQNPAQEGQWGSWEKQSCSAACGEETTVEQHFCVARSRV